MAGTLCIVLLASEFFFPLRLLGSFFHIAMNGMAASDKIFKILDLPEPQVGEKCLPDGALDVTLTDVHFSYEADMEAAKKASIHDFILTLPKGYDTEVGELGDTLSGGEKQRIGIARAFLHDAPMILMDEPTSNLDSLNEGIILRSLKESAFKKTIVLVSHRKSTMNVADVVYEMENGRIS